MGISLNNITWIAQEGDSSFLVAPNTGVMIWTVIAFLLTLYVLKRFAFPRISEALDKRQRAIEESIEEANRTREEANKILAEYKERLRAAREQAEAIVARAKKAGETREAEVIEQARQTREEMLAQTRRDIEAETRRAIEQIRSEVANLTVAATEKVTRKSLSAADQERLIEEALAEIDVDALSQSAARE